MCNSFAILLQTSQESKSLTSNGVQSLIWDNHNRIEVCPTRQKYFNITKLKAFIWGFLRTHFLETYNFFSKLDL